MKREIKFRGKDHNGKWHYGTYYFGVMYPTSFSGHYINDVLIDENTIGEFTGLKDKNGKEIYEGDVVTFNVTGKLREDDRVLYNQKGSVDIGIGLSVAYGTWQYHYCSDVLVIGNIHESKVVEESETKIEER